jgi:formylglycine-generating enzyme required for sulfatase activity
MIRLLFIALSALLTAAVSAAPAHAEQRLALLIGNQSYAAKVGPLKNPHTDVALIEAALKRLGFQVTVLKDADYRAMDVGLKRYAADLRRAGPGALGFFYYSGHGAANADTQVNYLMPVDVTNAEDESVWYQSLRQNQITDLLSKEAKDATQFVVFDACRNELHLSGGAAKAVGADKGFVPVGDTAGLLIAYATAPGRTASDAGEGGGAYAKALAEELVRPGVEAVTMFRAVQIRVKLAIGQDPWLSFPSLAPVYLAGREAAPAEVPKTQAQAPMSEAAQAWDRIKDSRGIVVLEAFRKQYGAANPLYDTLAAERIEELRQKVAINVPILAECDGLVVSVAMGKNPCIKPGSGEVFRDCPDCPEMVVVPAGSFIMGSPGVEPERSGVEGPQHRVTITKPFAVGRFAVKRDEFEIFVKDSGYNADNGCYIWSGGQWKRDIEKSWRSPGLAPTGSHPAICVSWSDAEAYAAWISTKTGKEYRLLSEAEREYVTRARNSAAFWWGTSITPDQANYAGDAEPYKGGGSKGVYRQQTVPVEFFKPNDWGLYQVHGNVWEWVEDCWDDSYENAPSDGTARTKAQCKWGVLRGGSWRDPPRTLRAASRTPGSPGLHSDNFGFRIARTLQP